MGFRERAYRPVVTIVSLGRSVSMFVPAARNCRIAVRTPAAPRATSATPASALGQPPGTSVGQRSSRTTPSRNAAKSSVGGLATTPGLSASAKDHLEHAAPSFARATADVAPVVAGDLAHQREAEAEAPVARLARALRPIERLEDPLALALRDTGPAVGDGERGAVRPRGDPDLDRLAAAVATRVLEQVADQPAEQLGVAVDERGLARDFGAGAR